MLLSGVPKLLLRLLQDQQQCVFPFQLVCVCTFCIYKSIGCTIHCFMIQKNNTPDASKSLPSKELRQKWEQYERFQNSYRMVLGWHCPPAPNRMEQWYQSTRGPVLVSYYCLSVQKMEKQGPHRAKHSRTNRRLVPTPPSPYQERTNASHPSM